MELINVNKLGVTKSTAVKKAVMVTFRGKTAEVGLYLTMARQVQILNFFK